MAYITLNKKHFFHNLDIIAKQTKSKDKIALVLKDNAYGHGLIEISQLAQEYGVSKAVVRSIDEAKRVERYFSYVLILAEIPKEKSEKFSYTINELSAIEKFPQGTRVELKVNTGMNRNGIQIGELQEALSRIKTRELKLEALFTHHACADEENACYLSQYKKFQALKEEFSGELRFHSCNSAAIFRENNFDEDMARVGIAAYGCLELPFTSQAKELLPVLSIYAKKISSRTLMKGEKIGYGGSHTLQENAVVSNYDFGYADGFFRVNSQGFTSVEGVKLAGRISMDNSSFLTEERELLIFNDARVVAKRVGTISYEILCALKERIPRIVF